jgi:hypothetical protein
VRFQISFAFGGMVVAIEEATPNDRDYCLQDEDALSVVRTKHHNKTLRLINIRTEVFAEFDAFLSNGEVNMTIPVGAK